MKKVLSKLITMLAIVLITAVSVSNLGISTTMEQQTDPVIDTAPPVEVMQSLFNGGMGDF